MEKITKAPIFKSSIIASSILLLTIMFAGTLISELWLVYGFVAFVIIIIFLIILIRSVIFLDKNRTTYKYPGIPLLINVGVLIVIYITPLNYIKDRIEFTLFYNSYENATKEVISTTTQNSEGIVILPSKYQFLSVGGGEAVVFKTGSNTAVFFYTFRGAPDGFDGFVKISKDGNIKDFPWGELHEIVALRDNWYYVSGK